MYLLDTNACIELLNGRSPALVQRMRQEKPADILLCSVVKAELSFGAQRSSKPRENAALLKKFFAQFQSLAFDDTCVEAYADIRAQLTRQGALIGPNDLLIAATARANAVTLVTHNTSEFTRVPGLKLEDWQV